MHKTRGALILLAVGLGVAGLATAEAPLTDAQLEQALMEGQVLEIEDIGVGVTKPERVTLEWNGITLRAAFKSLDMHRTKRTRFETGPERATLSFTDSFRYERAAYLLDRRLGLGMVPVTVLRTIDKKPGALVAWVEDALTEGDRLAKELSPDDPQQISQQRALMRLFDALIQNVDRNQGNRLYTRPDWKLHLIDHGRAFRLTKDLPPDFVHDPASVSRGVLAQLKSLERKKLGTLLEGTLSGQQIKLLLKRRDRILKKVEADLETYGEALVLF